MGVCGFGVALYVQVLHMATNARAIGNPVWNHNYRDEAMNFDMQQISRSCHLETHSRTALGKWILNLIVVDGSVPFFARIAARIKTRIHKA